MPTRAARTKKVPDVDFRPSPGVVLELTWSEGTPSEQEIEAIGIEREGGKRATFGDLSRVAFSELVRELEMLHD